MSRDQFTHTITNGHLTITRNDEPPIVQPVLHQPDFGPFTGTGAFTYGSPEVCLAHLDVLDWVAVLPTDDPITDAMHAVALHASGHRIHVWETGQGQLEGQSAVDRFQAAGYIGQAESEPQLRTTYEVIFNPAPLRVPLAIIGNPTCHTEHDWQRNGPALSWECVTCGASKISIDRPDPAEQVLPANVVWLNECYENSNPATTIQGLDYEARKRGATTVLPCFGMYHEGDPGTDTYVAQLPLSHYLNELDALPAAMLALLGSPPSFSFWTAEQLTDQDWAALRDWRAKHVKAAA